MPKFRHTPRTALSAPAATTSIGSVASPKGRLIVAGRKVIGYERGLPRMTFITAPPRELPFELGKPQSFQGLGLIPLFTRDEPALEYIGLDEAAAAGLVVTEIHQSG